MLSEFLIEVKLSEEQDKIAQIVTGSNGAQMKPTAYDEYVNASKGKIQKGKGKGSDGKLAGKGTSKNWRQPCTDYWRPDGCSLGHNCPKYHPRRQPGRYAICSSTKHYTSHCKRPIKPTSKNVEYDEDLQSRNAPADTWGDQWRDHTWDTEEYEAAKGKKSQGKKYKSKGKPNGKGTPRSITPRPTQVLPGNAACCSANTGNK